MNGMIWRDFVDSIREVGEPTPFKSKAQKRYKAQRKKNDIYTSGGGHKKPSTGAPFTTKAKRAGTDRLRFEEEVEPESFDTHDTLEPSIWLGGGSEEIRPRIRKHLMKIAQDFIDGLPVQVNIKDITLTGSLANYNWSNYSDVDLHIIVDFLQVDENRDLVKAFFDNARMKWNNKHNIRVKGYDVEIYVEDSREVHKSSGVYSLLNDEWIKRPRKYRNNIDFPSARRKADDLEFQVNIVDNLITAQKLVPAMKNIKRLKEKIKNMRRAGLESVQQEFSIENIAFKILRRNGTLDRLEDMKNNVYDSIMTVKEEQHGI
jgi:predicted nucleotidyltransferase